MGSTFLPLARAHTQTRVSLTCYCGTGQERNCASYGDIGHAVSCILSRDQSSDTSCQFLLFSIPKTRPSFAHAPCLLPFQSLPSALRTVLAFTVSSLTSQSATCFGTAGTAKPVAISAPRDWRTTGTRVSACGPTRCRNARSKVGTSAEKCYWSLG